MQWEEDYKTGLDVFFLTIYLQQGNGNLNDVIGFPYKRKKSRISIHELVVSRLGVLNFLYSLIHSGCFYFLIHSL